MVSYLRVVPLLVFVSLSLACCFGRPARPPAGPPPAPVDVSEVPTAPLTRPVTTQPTSAVTTKPAEDPPQVFTAQEIAQSLMDKGNDEFRKATKFNVQITGVVSKQEKSKEGDIGAIWFYVKVMDKMAGEMKEVQIFCGLKEAIKAKDPAAAKVAVGKTVTVRGQNTGWDRKLLSLNVNFCDLVEPGKP